MAISEIEWMRIFSTNLREIMREQGVSPGDLADELCVTTGTVSKYMNGRIMPSVKALANIAHVLDVDIYDILYFGDYVV